MRKAADREAFGPKPLSCRGSGPGSWFVDCGYLQKSPVVDHSALLGWLNAEGREMGVQPSPRYHTAPEAVDRVGEGGWEVDTVAGERDPWVFDLWSYNRLLLLCHNHCCFGSHRLLRLGCTDSYHHSPVADAGAYTANYKNINLIHYTLSSL